MSKLCSLLIFLIAPAVILGQNLNVRRCNNLPEPTYVKMIGCTRMPCIVRRGFNQTANFEIQFSARSRVNSITTLVTRNAWGSEQPHPLPPHIQNGCINLIGAVCPLVLTRSARQRVLLPLGSTIFQTPQLVRFRVTQKSQDNSTISCFELDMRTIL